MIDHDFAAQRKDTFAVYQDLTSRVDIPDRVALEVHFKSGDDADGDEATKVLEEAGFMVERTGDLGAETLRASRMLDRPEAASVWALEEHATQLVLPFGFRPEGWDIST